LADANIGGNNACIRGGFVPHFHVAEVLRIRLLPPSIDADEVCAIGGFVSLFRRARTICFEIASMTDEVRVCVTAHVDPPSAMAHPGWMSANATLPRRLEKVGGKVFARADLVTLWAMARRALNFITGLSLLLCMLSAACWVRTRYVSDSIGWSRAGAPPPVYGEYSARGCNLAWGRLTIFMMFHSSAMAAHPGFQWKTQPVSQPLRWQGLPWFSMQSERHARGWYRSVTIPLWFVFLTTLILPVTRVHMLLRRRSIGQNRCTECGYDLRATPARCPECGSVPAS
jgi:hypothetical protein